MGFVDWLNDWLSCCRKGSYYDALFIQYQALESNNQRLLADNNTLLSENKALIRENSELSLTNTSLLEECKNKPFFGSKTDLDSYCEINFKIVDPIVYKDKGEINNKLFPMSLQELIMPHSYMVQNLFKNISKLGTRKDYFQRLGDKLAKTIVWTDDYQFGIADRYLYPSEILCLKHDDCEGHASVMSSFHPEIGICWGTIKVNDELIGHSFNCFLYDGVLWVLDTVANKAIIKPYIGSDYHINIIVTINNYYVVDPGLVFGVVVR